MPVNVKKDMITYYMNVKMPKKVQHCKNCKAANAWITSAHYPGLCFCTIACLWKYDEKEKKTIKNIGIPQKASQP